MRYNTGVSTISNAQSNLMTVDPDKAAKVAAMLVNNYTSYVTPVREVIINGLEAVEGQDDGQVEVEFVSHMESYEYVFSNKASDDESDHIIRISDNGCGMSHDFAKNKFVHLTASSKDSSDDAIGGFGIGAKSVASISQHTVFRTVQDGVATVIVFGISDKGATTTVSDPIETDEPNGTEVSIHVDKDIFHNILENIEDQFLDWIDPQTPLSVSYGSTKFNIGSKSKEVIHTYTGDNGVVVHVARKNTERYYFKSNSSMIRCVGMPYPMISSIDDTADIAQNLHRHLDNHLPGTNGCADYRLYFIVDVPAQDITIDSSRERVAETLHLRDLINGSIDKAMEDYVVSVAKDLKNSRSSTEFFDKIQNNNYAFINLYFVRGVLGGSSNIVSRYNDYVEKNESLKGGSILSIIDKEGKSLMNGSIQPLDKNTVGGIFNSYQAQSIHTVLSQSETVDEALGIDTYNCGFISVRDSSYNPVVVSINNEGVYDEFLPDEFLELFDKEEEINLEMELVKWHLGIDFYTSDKSYSRIRRSMMSRGRGKGKNGSGSKREIFSYIDNGEKKVVAARDIDSVLQQWNKNGISTVKVLENKHDDAEIDRVYREDMISLSKIVENIYEGNVVVFISSRRSNSRDKNIRILEGSAEKAGVEVDTDTFFDKDVSQASARITNKLSGDMGYLFFEKGLDSPFGYSRFDIGYKWLEAEYNGTTIQDLLVNFLLLDPEKYNSAKESVAKTIDVVSDEKPYHPEEEYHSFITGGIIRGILGAFSYRAGSKEHWLDTAGTLIVDGLTFDEYARRAKILDTVSDFANAHYLSHGTIKSSESVKFIGDIIATAQEVVDNPDSMVSRMISQEWN